MQINRTNQKTQRRKVYLKPAILYEALLEAQAGSPLGDVLLQDLPSGQ